MNKAELCAAAGKVLGSKASGERAANAVLGAIVQGLKKDRKVSIVGFGTFVVRHRKARTGRDPRNGKVIHIKRSKSVGFKAGEILRGSL